MASADGALGHGWVCITEDAASRKPPLPIGIMANTSRGVGDGTVVLHLPPRGSGGGSSAGPSDGGVAKIAPGFPQSVERMAWSGNRAYFALRDERLMATSQGDWQRRVLSLTAVPVSAGSLSVGGSERRGITAWEYPPNRPELVGVLPGKVELTGFGACVRGPIALLRTSRLRAQARSEPTFRAGSSLELMICVEAIWRSIPLPWEGANITSDQRPGPSARFWVLCTRDSVGLAVLNNQSDDSITIWTGQFVEEPAVDPSIRDSARQDGASAGEASRAIRVDWSFRTVSLRLPANKSEGNPGRVEDREVLPIPDHVVEFDGAIVAAAWESKSEREDVGRVRLAVLRADRADEFVSEEGPTRSYTLASMEGWAGGSGPRVAIIWSPARSGEVPAGKGQLPSQMIREVSATSGRVLFEGPFRPRSGVSFGQYRMLALMLVALMAAVLLFVLRRGPLPKAGNDPKPKS
ncbi:MAG: hypothetical protein ACK4WH_15050 [Phycisphaerales bacterium]